MTEPTEHPLKGNSNTKKLIKQLADPSKKLEVVDANTLIDYDVPQLEKFVNTVFHSELDNDEFILSWDVKGLVRGYPKDVDDRFDKWRRLTQPRGLYYATSTCRKDPSDKKLYNRGSLFKRLHVVVLDDIGTKVPADKLPEGFTPTYIIESSPNNYQYGYVLETPLDDFDQASALIQLIYTAGFSDAGGKMATKIVRLPDGVNGKDGKNKFFHVNLQKLDGPLWTPEKILHVLDIGVTWADIEKDATLAAERKGLNARGTTAWQPMAKNAGLSGVADPVLDWLYEEGKVKQETNDWVTVECPWCHTHTNGDDTAGYSPVGYGEGDYSTLRTFHCFHEHCVTHKAPDFLAWVAHEGGPECPVSDASGDLVARYAYDPINDGAWEVRDTVVPKFIPLKGFNNMYGNQVSYIDKTGKQKSTTFAKQWMASPYRVDVMGQTFDPAQPERLIEVHGALALNMFKQPLWGAGKIDQADIDLWLEFITYLIPEESEREYFLDWLACKAQDMGFRGAAILMVAPRQGTGRTTLADMLGTLFNKSNTERVSFPNLCKASEATFNEWMEKPLVFTDETLSLGGENYYKVYESLKEIFDPRPAEIVINPKYGKKRTSMCHTSYLMFSNHVNALSTAADDRRIYVISNAELPWPGEKFAELNEWIHELDDDGQPYWARSVWRWLQNRKVSPDEMTKPAPRTTGKMQMALETKSVMEVAINAVIDNYPLPLLNPNDVKMVCLKLGARVDYAGDSAANSLVNRLIRAKTRAPHESLILRVGSKTLRPRLIADHRLPESMARYSKDIGKVQRGHVARELALVHIDGLVQIASDVLDLADM
jgi:hypothetical protein